MCEGSVLFSHSTYRAVVPARLSKNCHPCLPAGRPDLIGDPVSKESNLLTFANYLNEKPMPLISFSPFTVKNPHRIFNTTAVFYGSMAANLIQSHTFFVVT